MSTRIHLFIEFDRDQAIAPFSVADNIRSISLAELWVPSNYALFDALAGGRSHSLGVAEKSPLYPPRGLPAPVSLEVYNRYYHIVEDPDYPDLQHDRLPPWVAALQPVSAATAEEWIEHGLSTLGPEENHRLGRPRRARVSDPDWHTASWLSLTEIESSLAFHAIDEPSIPCEMIAYLTAMKSLESSLGDCRTRIVFWFDN